MDIDALTDDDRKQLAKDLAAELDTGLYGNRAVLSRRQLLTLAGGSAGVAGLVALGVDPATAQSAAGQVGTSSSPEDVFAFDLDVQGGAEFNDNDLTGVGSLSTPDGRIGTRYAVGDPQRAAPIASFGDMDLYVSPSGDDANDGTDPSEPVRNLYEALANVPKNIYHRVRIHLDYGTYSNPSPDTLAVVNHFNVSQNAVGLRILGHDPDNYYYDSSQSVEDVTVSDAVQVNGCSGSEETPQFRSIHFDLRVQAYDSTAKFIDCRFDGGAGTYDDMVQTKNARIWLQGCDFVGSGTETGVSALDGSQDIIEDCTGTDLDTGLRLRRSIVHDDAGAGDNLTGQGVAAGLKSLVIGGPFGVSQGGTGIFQSGNGVRSRNYGSDTTLELDTDNDLNRVKFLHDGELAFTFEYRESANEVSFREGFTKRMVLDLSTGDLSLSGSLTEDASL